MVFAVAVGAVAGFGEGVEASFLFWVDGGGGGLMVSPGIGTWISYFFFSCFVVGNLFFNHERGKEERNTDISPRGGGSGLPWRYQLAVAGVAG